MNDYFVRKTLAWLCFQQSENQKFAVHLKYKRLPVKFSAIFIMQNYPNISEIPQLCHRNMPTESFIINKNIFWRIL